MRLGSLFSGYGGLDLAAAAHYGAEVAWHAEVDAGACRVLDARWPGTPNLGDVTTTDWAGVEPVGIITAGYPCQPFSHAGNRRGSDDDRHLWPHAALAVRALRPRVVVLENVAGHLSLGLGRVLGDLAEAGYDAEWVCLPASAVGAPHRRDRVFIVARDAHSSNEGPQPGVQTPLAEPEGAGGGRAAAADPPHQGEGPCGQHPGRPGPGCHRIAHQPPRGRDGLPASDTRALTLLPTPVADHSLGLPSGGDYQSLPDAVIHGVKNRARAALLPTPGTGLGPYQAACDRWAAVIGRPAPDPTERGKDGRRRLSPRFVEWMMGLPDGWVTDPALGLTRSAQLRILGNGVVPQQAAQALAVIETH